MFSFLHVVLVLAKCDYEEIVRLRKQVYDLQSSAGNSSKEKAMSDEIVALRAKLQEVCDENMALERALETPKKCHHESEHKHVLTQQLCAEYEEALSKPLAEAPLNAGHARLVNSDLASKLIKLKADVIDEDSQVGRVRFGLVPVNAQPRGFIPLN